MVGREGTDALRAFIALVRDDPGSVRSLELDVAAAPSPPAVHGFTRQVQTSGINHAPGEHGNATQEARRGLRGIDAADLARVAEIVARAERTIIHGGAAAARGQSIEYVARLDGAECYYVETVGTKRRRLTFKTMWKR